MPSNLREKKPTSNGAPWDAVAFLIGIAFDVLQTVLVILKTPIAILLAIYIVLVFFSYSASYLATTALSALMPLCSLPLIGSKVSFCEFPSQQQPRYPELIDLQTRFEEIMESSATSANLALGMKQSEVAVRDLNTLVKVSSLPSKEVLSPSLDEFVSSSKEAGRNLAKLGSGVGGAVDAMLAMDEYAVKSLEAIEAKESERSIFSVILFPFGAPSTSRRQLMDTFNQAAEVMEVQLKRLIGMATATSIDLNELEEQLGTIHDIVTREQHQNRLQTDELLARLWTILGGNRIERANFASHSQLLSQLSTFRARAAAQVAGTIVRLNVLSSDLDELRERVAQPILIPDDIVPIEVHIATIRKGVQRLSDGRGKAKLRERQALQRIIDGSPQHPALES